MLVAEWTGTYDINCYIDFRNSSRKSAWLRFDSTTTEFCLRYQALRSTHSEFQLLLSVQISLKPLSLSITIVFKLKSSTEDDIVVAEWTNTYDIHHGKIFRNSCRKFASVGFEPSISKFFLDILPNWITRLEFNSHSELPFDSYSYFIVCYCLCN